MRTQPINSTADIPTNAADNPSNSGTRSPPAESDSSDDHAASEEAAELDNDADKEENQSDTYNSGSSEAVNRGFTRKPKIPPMPSTIQFKAIYQSFQTLFTKQKLSAVLEKHKDGIKTGERSSILSLKNFRELNTPSILANLQIGKKFSQKFLTNPSKFSQKTRETIF